MSSSYLFIPATSSHFLSRSCVAAAWSSWHNLYSSVQLQTLSLILRPLRLCVFVVHSYDRPLAGASPVGSFYIDVWGDIMILAMIWWPKPAVELVKMCLWLQRKVEKARLFLTAALQAEMATVISSLACWRRFLQLSFPTSPRTWKYKISIVLAL